MLHVIAKFPTLLLLWAIFKESMTQDGDASNPPCGESNIVLGNKWQAFNIPPSGMFTKPVKCTYKIIGPPYTTIDYNITGMRIGTKSNCDTEYLKISASSTDPGSKICGTKTEVDLLSSRNNTAYIEFYLKDGNAAGDYVQGFISAVPIENEEKCGPRFLTLESKSAELRIPALEKSFDRITACIYNINGNDNKILSFKITDLNLGPDGKCEKDFLKVADDEWHIENTTNVFCGTKPPTKVFESKGNTMVVLMLSSTTPKSTLVKATYSKVENTPNVTPNEPSCGESNIVLGSGSKEFSIPANGMLTNPINCTYKVTSPQSTKITYNITSIKIGDGSSCEKNFLVLSSTMDGLDTAKKVCGTKIPEQPLKSDTNVAYILLSLGDAHSDGAFVKGLLAAENSAPRMAFSLMFIFEALTFIWLQ